MSWIMCARKEDPHDLGCTGLAVMFVIFEVVETHVVVSVGGADRRVVIVSRRIRFVNVLKSIFKPSTEVDC
jgi:hypothetical protein